jgi:cell division protein FtsN
MSDGRDDEPVEHQQDDAEWDEERPRSLLSTLWFRALLILVVLGAVAAVSMPYLTETPGTTTPVAQAPDGAGAAPAAQSGSTVTAAGAGAVTAAPSPTPADTGSMPATTTKDAVARREPAKTGTVAATTKASAKRVANAAEVKGAARRPEATPGSAATGEWFVQVGAFRDRATAERTASALKQRGYTVEQSTTAARRGSTASTTPARAALGVAAAGGGDRYDVVVTGAAAKEITQRLSSRGLAVESARDEAVVKPSLALRDAVALSNDLRSEGYKVNVRRVAKRAPAKAAAATVVAGDTLHRVRVGAFADRAAATQAADKLRALGYGVYIARGHE